MSGLPVRSTVHASGYAALLAIVVFGIGGLWAVTTDQGPQGPYASEVVPAGTVQSTESVNRAVIWGGGEDIVPEDVSCTVTRRDNGMPRELDLTRAEVRPTVQVLQWRSTDASPAEMTLLASMPNLPGKDITCSGGGLETFALGELRLGPPLWVVGIGFFVFAGVAAIWATVTLTLTRKRGGDGRGPAPSIYARSM